MYVYHILPQWINLPVLWKEKSSSRQLFAPGLEASGEVPWLRVSIWSPDLRTETFLEVLGEGGWGVHSHLDLGSKGEIETWAFGLYFVWGFFQVIKNPNFRTL